MNETPANGGYMIAAYVAVALIMVGYAWSLWWRSREVGRRESGATDH